MHERKRRHETYSSRIGTALLAWTALLSVAAVAAQADRSADKTAPESQQVEDSAQSDMSLNIGGPNMDKALLNKAGAVRPVPADALQQAVPTSLAGLSRASLDGRTDWIGPVGMTTVTAVYEDESGHGLVLELFDPAGIPQTGSRFLDIPPAGQTTQQGRTTLEGLAITGYPAVRQLSADRLNDVVQVKVGPRLRVTATAMILTADRVTTALEELDLARLASLAPEPPPAM